MRILHVTKKYPNTIGGDATCVFYLKKEQEKLGHRVFVLTANSDELNEDTGVYKFGLKEKTNSWDKVSVKRLTSLLFFSAQSLLVIKKIKPDIIHSHSSDLGFLSSIWARLLGIPIINTCHGVLFPYKSTNKILKSIEYVLLKLGFFNKIITVDENSVIYFKKNGFKNAQYIHMLGVDIEAFRKIQKDHDEDREIKLIFVGRLDPLKNLYGLIEAASQLKHKHIDFKIFIVGDGPVKKGLIQFAKDLGVYNETIFLGKITNRAELINIYRRSDVLIICSLWEGFPLVILEAWAAGLAVVATNVGGITRLCNNNVNSLLVEPANITALCDAISALVNDKGLRERLGANGRKLVEDNFSWANIALKLDDVYRSFLQEELS